MMPLLMKSDTQIRLYEDVASGVNSLKKEFKRLKGINATIANISNQAIEIGLPILKAELLATTKKPNDKK